MIPSYELQRTFYQLASLLVAILDEENALPSSEELNARTNAIHKEVCGIVFGNRGKEAVVLPQDCLFLLKRTTDRLLKSIEDSQTRMEN